MDVEIKINMRKRCYPNTLSPTIPTPTFASLNRFAALTYEYKEDMQHLAAQALTPQTNPPPPTCTNSSLSDSGASSHFLVDGADAVNVQVDEHPPTITLPNGKTINSTHTCNLDLPWLQGEATQAHIVPGLMHASLVSTARFCAGPYACLPCVHGKIL